MYVHMVSKLVHQSLDVAADLHTQLLSLLLLLLMLATPNKSSQARTRNTRGKYVIRFVPPAQNDDDDDDDDDIPWSQNNISSQVITIMTMHSGT